MEKKPWKNQEILEELYIKQKIPKRKIAEKLGCSLKTVLRWTKKFGMRKVCPKPRGDLSHNWKGGRFLGIQGYVKIYKPTHPRVKYKYIHEHILVMEEHLGRYLTPEERVHHINFIKNDNRLENLVLCKNTSEHILAHKSLEKIGIKLALKKLREEKIIFDEKTKTYKESVVGNV